MNDMQEPPEQVALDNALNLARVSWIIHMLDSPSNL